MRHLLTAFFLLVLASPFPAQAVVVSGQCSLDEPVTDGNQEFNQCPFGDENGFLINQGYNGARLEPDDSLSFTPIWVHNLCRYVDARGITDPLFIPFNSLAEWQAFINNAPSGVHLAQCCLPRALTVGDVPPITAATQQPCSTGWVFNGLVNPSNFNQLLAAPNGTSDASTFTLEAGVVENPNYPITGLPIQRDDIGAMLPQGASGGQSYVAKYTCTVTTGNSTTTNIQLIQFALACESHDWIATGPTCASGPFEIFSTPCPGGGAGTIIKQLVRTCPSQAVTVEELSNTCSGTCVPGQVGNPFTVPCAGGLGGLTTRIHVRQCPSGQIVDQDIATTCQEIPCSFGENSCPAGANADCVFVGNQCTCTCTGGESCPTSTTLDNSTQECPSGPGAITFQNIRACHTSNNQCICTVNSTQISSTCNGGGSCAPVTITNETRACPEGQTGSIGVKITKLCFSRKPLGESAVTVTSGDTTCFCITNEQQISNTCTGSCPAVTDLGNSTEACPSGQVGSVIVNTKKICATQDGQCVCHNEKTIVTSACEVCPASVDLGNVIEACPAGQTGQIIRHHTKTCSVTNNQCDCTDHFDLVSNTCTSNTCVPETDLGNETRACPTGQTGCIVVHKTRLCHQSCQCGGAQCVCHDEETTVSNTCTTDCPASTDLGNRTLACPSGQNGSIVIHRVKTCSAVDNQCQCTLTDTVVSDTCEVDCPHVTDLGNDTRQCPSGQEGEIVVHRQKICTACFGTCQCSIQEIPVSNTCHPVCTPVTDLGNTTQDCPAGQTGQIVINTKRFCQPVCIPVDGVNQTTCACHDESTQVSNTCHSTCTPSQRTVCLPCPEGQLGSIVQTITHICDCPGGRDVISEQNFCVIAWL